MKDKKNPKDSAKSSPMRDSCCTPNVGGKKPQDPKHKPSSPQKKGGKV